MHSSIIGKVEKAKRYAKEPERVVLSEFRADFRGEHNSYVVSYKGGKWNCTCSFFPKWKMCSHTMALQQMLTEMLPEAAAVSPPATDSST